MSRRRRRSRAASRITQILGADNIDTRDYHGHVGDIIRIDPYTLFKIEKILVAIHAEKAGVVEHGLAQPIPKSDEWQYTATVENPELDDWSVAVSAVEAPTVERKSYARRIRLQ